MTGPARSGAMRAVLAVDLGGSGLRVTRVDARGRLAGLQMEALALADEVDPETWWAAFQRALDRIDLAGIGAVCITGMTRTQVFLDRATQPVRGAITVRDSRAAAVVVDRPGLDAYHPAARLLWLAQQEPAVLARVAAVVDPKDFLAARLTGVIATDPMSGRLLAEADLSGLGLPDLTPPQIEPGGVIGSVRAGPLRGVPVVMAGHDTWAAVVGLGAMRDGGAYNLSGTTEVLGVLSREPRTAPGLIAAPWGAGLHHLGGPSNAGGGTLDWAGRLLGAAPGPALDALLAGARDPAPALFLPYLDGERTPHWDPGRRGAFLGLSMRHGPVDFAWAVLEGIACLNRMVLARAGEAAAVRFGGGGARSALWCQIKADALGIPIETMVEPEAGLLGAGITAWQGACPAPAVARVFTPRPEQRAFYDRLYAAYCAADAATAALHI